MTTPTTPKQARKIANQIEAKYRCDHPEDLVGSIRPEIAALRSLADQVEALTAELNNVGLPKLAMCPACMEEVPMLQCDQLTQDAKRYRWLKDERHYDGWYPDYYNGRGRGRHEWTLWSEIDDLDKAIDAAIAKGTA